MSRKLRILGAAAILFIFAGCIERTVKGGTSIYRMEAWAIAGTAVGGVAAGVAGFFVRRKIARLGWAMLIGGPAAAIFGAPTMYFDVVKVDSEHYERSGGFSASINESRRFDDMQAIKYVSKEERVGRRMQTKHYFEITNKSGQTESVSLGTLLQAAAPEIFEKAKAKGVTLLSPPE